MSCRKQYTCIEGEKPELAQTESPLFVVTRDHCLDRAATIGGGAEYLGGPKPARAPPDSANTHSLKATLSNAHGHPSYPPLRRQRPHPLRSRVLRAAPPLQRSILLRNQLHHNCLRQAPTSLSKSFPSFSQSRLCRFYCSRLFASMLWAILTLSDEPPRTGTVSVYGHLAPSALRQSERPRHARVSCDISRPLSVQL